jgi:hypothetical protein
MTAAAEEQRARAFQEMRANIVRAALVSQLDDARRECARLRPLRPIVELARVWADFARAELAANPERTAAPEALALMQAIAEHDARLALPPVTARR